MTLGSFVDTQSHGSVDRSVSRRRQPAPWLVGTSDTNFHGPAPPVTMKSRKP